MTETRSEIVSLRLSAEEKRRLQDAVDRANSVAEAAGQPRKSLSDWARETLVRGTEAAAVFPSQTVHVRVEPYPGPSMRDIAAALRLVLAAAEGAS